MKSYGNTYKSKSIRNTLFSTETPQSMPIPGKGKQMTPNNAGGWSFAISSEKAIERFLIMGSAQSYYTAEGEALNQNADAILGAVSALGIARVIEILETLNAPGSNRARVDSNIFMLALLSTQGDQWTRESVYDCIARRTVIRTMRNMYDLVYQRHLLLEGRGGWGTGFRRAVGLWLNGTPMRELAMQFLKYRNSTYDRIWGREERLAANKRWSGKMTLNPGVLLGAVKPVPQTEERSSLYNYVAARDEKVRSTIDAFFAPEVPPSKRTKGLTEEGRSAFDLLWAFEHAQKTTDIVELLTLIRKYGLTWEMVPNTWFSRDDLKTARRVWSTLIGMDGEKWAMPMGALLRNLSRFSSLGLFDDKDVRNFIVNRFTDGEAEKRIKGARLHPIDLLDALRVYETGTGREGKSTWPVVPAVVDMLEAAFYTSFNTIEPCGENLLLALDISGSMWGGRIRGLPGVSPAEGAAVMAMVTARREHGYEIVAFDTTLRRMNIRASDSLENVKDKMAGWTGGGTDCAQPMVWALNQQTTYAGFAVYTDSETWAGRIQPSQALKQYRQKRGVDARLAVVGMVSNGFSIADPTDPGMLDFVGFDSAAPAVMSQFFAGKL